MIINIPKKMVEEFENIKYQLDDENHSPCILEDIPQYKCNKCIKIDNYINDAGVCMDCEK